MTGYRHFAEFYFLDPEAPPSAARKTSKIIVIDKKTPPQLVELPNGAVTIKAPDNAVACRFFKIAADETGRPQGERIYEPHDWFLYDRASIGGSTPIRNIAGERFDVVASPLMGDTPQSRPEYLQFEPGRGAEHRFRIPQAVLAV
ncbi:MAG: hypothetical protein WAO98_03100 [Alphaproteobacteria bacterium]